MEIKRNFSLEELSDSLTNMSLANRNVDDFYDSAYSRCNRNLSYEEVKEVIASGSAQEKMMISRSFFKNDGFYQRIVLYLATYLKYAAVLVPNPRPGQLITSPHIQKKYYSAIDFMENSELDNLFPFISMKVLVDGAYFGYVTYGAKDKIHLLGLPTTHCRTILKSETGKDIVEFNVEYFYTIKERGSRTLALKAFPKEISRHFRRYDKGTAKNKWIMLSEKNGVYFSIMENNSPLFISTIPAILDYQDTVSVEKKRNLEEIRKILVQRIPHLNTGELLFEPVEAEQIHKGSVEMMKDNPNISVLTTYADTDSISSKTASEAVRNNLEKMMNNIFYEGGVSPQIFAATGRVSLDVSLQNDLSLSMILANKYSSLVSNVINTTFGNSNINFKYKILPISYYNEKDYINNSQKLGALGYSFLLPSLAMGLSQRDLGNIKDLENDVLKLNEKLIPLSSAFQSGKQDQGTGEVGAPVKEDSKKAERTIDNEESLEGGKNVNG